MPITMRSTSWSAARDGNHPADIGVRRHVALDRDLDAVTDEPGGRVGARFDAVAFGRYRGIDGQDDDLIRRREERQRVARRVGGLANWHSRQERTTLPGGSAPMCGTTRAGRPVASATVSGRSDGVAVGSDTGLAQNHEVGVAGL